MSDQAAIDRNDSVSTVPAEGIDPPVRVKLFEFGQGNNTGDTIMPASLKQAQEDRQIAFEIRIIDGQNVFRMSIEITAW